MELQFERTALNCLNPVAAQVRKEEQTQELRISDGMPDIGRVLGTWGQVLLRGKEWRNGGMIASGGVMVWVLYEAEDGSGNHSLETWIPFQMKWDFPETRRDGVMQVAFRLGSIDARSVSARKLMVRATISAMGEAWEPVQMEVYSAGEMPRDVQLLTHHYPMRLPREAGEQSYAMDEELMLPASVGNAEKILHYNVDCRILEQKVMSDKVVFRGNAALHALIRTQDHDLVAWDYEVPFSQFAELERDYGSDAEVRTVGEITGVELELLSPEKVRFKAGFTGQYVVSDRTVVAVTEDAYSISRTLKPQIQEAFLPGILEERQESIRVSHTEEMDAERIVDVSFRSEHPRQYWNDGMVHMEMPSQIQILYFDREGRLQGRNCRCAGELHMPTDAQNRVSVQLFPGNDIQTILSPSIDLRCDVNAHIVTTTDSGIRMVTGLELGEEIRPDPARPGIIVRRCGGRKLWDLAKSMNATVEDICRANQLQGEPEEDRMLLIPVQ